MLLLSYSADSSETKSSDKCIQVSDTPAMILKLEEDMKKIKLQLEKDILSERQRANEAEHKASLVARAEEQRVADLGRYLCVNTVLLFQFRV